MFKKIFNCSGYIYKLNSVNFTSEFTAWTAELVSMNEEKVISCEYIDNVFNQTGDIAQYIETLYCG